MKILFIGAATSNHTIRWVNALSGKGHEVMLVCRQDQKDVKYQISSDVLTRHLEYCGGFGYYLNVPQMRKIYSAFKPDVVNAHYVSGYGTLARLARLSPLVLSAWGSDVYDFPYHNAFCRSLVNKNLRYADAIACTSHAMAEQTRAVMGSPEEPITVTPFGVDTSLFFPAQYKSQNARPVIGIVKYLEPIYDIGLLIKAFALVFDAADTKPILLIYGSGSMKESLYNLVESLGIKESVSFYDTIPNTQVPSALRKFDIFVNCSKQESFGVAVVEAMACGLPVVVTNTEGFREVVNDGVTGIIIKDREPQSLANALLKLLKNPQMREKMGKQGRRRVLEKYDWANDVTIMENLYQSVIGNMK